MIRQNYIDELRAAAHRARRGKRCRVGIDARVLLMLLQEIETHRIVLQLEEPRQRRNGVRHVSHKRPLAVGLSF